MGRLRLNLHKLLDKIEDVLFDRNVAQLTGWIMFVGGIIGWPLTATTVFSSEPQGVLGLSWVAVIYSGFQVLQQTYTNKMVVSDEHS